MEADRASEEATQSADCGLVVAGGAVMWNRDLLVPIVTGASRAGEEDIVKGRIEPLRSQRA
eukprot:5281752-Pyramimonas_sp.AAC.1